MLKKIKTIYIDSESKDKEEFKKIVLNEKFDSDVLISTSVLDNGVNICDNAIENVIILYFDKIAFLQSLGRIRLKKDQYINVYLANFNSNYFRKIYYNLSKAEAAYYEFKENPKDYVFKGKHNNPELFTCVVMDKDGNYEANPLAFEKLERNLDFFAEMYEKCEKPSNAAIIEQLNWLGIPYERRIFGLNPDEIDLLLFVYSYLDKAMDKKESSRFLEEFKNRAQNMPDSAYRADRKDNDFTVKKVNEFLKRHNMAQFIGLIENGDFINSKKR